MAAKRRVDQKNNINNNILTLICSSQIYIYVSIWAKIQKIGTKLIVNTLGCSNTPKKPQNVVLKAMLIKLFAISLRSDAALVESPEFVLGR